jgi:hypothetical protein
MTEITRREAIALTTGASLPPPVLPAVRRRRDAEARRNLAHLGARQPSSSIPDWRVARSCVPVHDVRHADRMGF